MTPLEKILREDLQTKGSMSVSHYMSRCLYHPQHGYYMSQQPFAEGGDFITAPELTPLFGQTLAVWVVTQWEALGKPAPFTLLEAGAGRGVLMKDILSALKRIAPACFEAAQARILETSPRLRGEQALTLNGYDIQWFETLSECDFSLPTLFFANELLDAFPIRQWVDETERKVFLQNGEFAFSHPDEAVTREDSPALEDFVTEIQERLTQGAALLIDYGDMASERDTLQAVQKHGKVSPLHEPGLCDITAHVNFGRVVELLGKERCHVEEQGVFLMRHGMALRGTQALETAPDEVTKKNIEGSLHRLLSPAEMGGAFKTLTYTPSSL